MKISEFCKMFQLSEYTIRFYVKKGLLVPNTRNKQYVFTEECISDMNIIIELKNYLFSLEEIHNLISLKRMSNFATSSDKEKQRDFYKKKREELINKKNEYKKILNDLQEFTIELE